MVGSDLEAHIQAAHFLVDQRREVSFSGTSAAEGNMSVVRIRGFEQDAMTRDGHVYYKTEHREYRANAKAARSTRARRLGCPRNYKGYVLHECWSQVCDKVETTRSLAIAKSCSLRLKDKIQALLQRNNGRSNYLLYL